MNLFSLLTRICSFKTEKKKHLFFFMRDNEKSAISLTPPSNGLSDTQFSTLNSTGRNDLEGLEKYNTEVKHGATFYESHMS
jgi:hypothetical protein